MRDRTGAISLHFWTHLVSLQHFCHQPNLTSNASCFRPGVADSIAVLQNSKVRVVMITGDAEPTAAAVSRVLGIRSEGMKMLSGSDLEEMSEEKLKAQVDSIYCFYR